MSIEFDEEKYWNNVKTTAPSECWRWQARTDHDGYGIYYDLGKHHRAHRVAYLIKTGNSPEVVMHLCDEPACCNPAHLAGGSQRENMRDRNRKDRQAKGSRNGRAKLCAEEVEEIRKRYESEATSYRKLGDAYGLDHTTIGAIIRREIWTHLD